VEAISFILGLDSFMPRRILIRQFGDTFQKNIESELPEHVRDVLTRSRGSFLVSRQRPIVSVCHSTPPSWVPEVDQRGMCPAPMAAIKIGRTMFETSSVPLGWVPKLLVMDQIWVPTKFHVETFSRGGVPRSKLVVIPESVDTDVFDPACYVPIAFQYRGLENKFVFLSIFKWEERKGWKVLIKAFFHEFHGSNPPEVGLLIVTRKTEKDQNPEMEIDKLLFETKAELGIDKTIFPPVVLDTSRKPESDIATLYRKADAFVLASKGEGWGRPVAEAMSMEVPVICTNWSGPTEFLTPENSYGLDYTLGPVDEHATGEGTSGHLWAEPSIDHLRQLMRHIYENPEEAKQKGIQGRKDMLEKYSIPAVAEIIYKQLQLSVHQYVNRSQG